MSLQKIYPYILIIGSTIGLIASFLLMVETITLIKNPAADLPCNINPFVSCNNAIISEQGELFGFPNPLLGIVAFSMLSAIGVMLLFGGKAKKPLWLLINLGLLTKVIFVVWFVYQSFYNLGTLCIYCMVVWAITWPLFLYSTLWNFKEGHFPKNKTSDKILSFIYRNHPILLALWYIVIVFLILLKFRDFFLS